MFLNTEMENIKNDYEADIQYVVKKWDIYIVRMIGLMFTMAIGLLTLAVSNFLPKREKKEDN